VVLADISKEATEKFTGELNARRLAASVKITDVTDVNQVRKFASNIPEGRC
jgi:hypothetical protein